MPISPNPPQPATALTVGTHLAPEDGACLMEWVSQLAGEPWTDHPATTHRLLSHLGRLVNDAMSATGRQALIPLGPRLQGLDSDDPRIAADLAGLTTRYALSVRPGLRLAWMHDAARRHAATAAERSSEPRPESPVRRLRRRIYDHGPAHRAVETAVLVLARAPDSDRHLLRLLEEAIAHLEATRGGGHQTRVSLGGSVDQR